MKEYFTLEEITPILNLQLRDVQRMLERGNLPAQRVGGEWRISRKEIVEWLEGKVEVAGSDSGSEAELIEWERVIVRLVSGRNIDDLPISELILPEGIQVPLTSRTKTGIIREMVEAAMRTNYLWDAREMERAVTEREEMYPTAMGNGVALMHPRRPMADILGEPFIALGRSFGSVPFSNDGLRSDVFFLLCSTNDTQHVRTLARLSRIITAAEFLPNLRELEDPQAILKLVKETENALA